MNLPWRELRSDLHRFVAVRVPRDDADDVVQDALARIYRGMTNVRDQDRLTPWIYQVTRSAITDHFRRRKIVEPLEEEPPVEPIADDRVFGRSRTACSRSWRCLPSRIEKRSRSSSSKGARKSKLPRGSAFRSRR